MRLLFFIFFAGWMDGWMVGTTDAHGLIKVLRIINKQLDLDCPLH